MKRYGLVKFPNSVQLFKFVQKVLMHQKGGKKVRDQEVGSILSFNPSDCSHWKRGEKNVKSVFGLAKIAKALKLESALIHDVASGITDLDEAYFEYAESVSIKAMLDKITGVSSDKLAESRKRVLDFVAGVHKSVDFNSPPLYLPEVTKCFPYISTQPVDMLDRLSRILRIKAGQYCVQFKKGELKPQTRLSMVRDLARIVFEGERSRYPELGPLDPETVYYEETIFCANLLIPKDLLRSEMAKTDCRSNIVTELSNHFWAPKSLVGFQLQEVLKSDLAVSANLSTKASAIEIHA